MRFRSLLAPIVLGLLLGLLSLNLWYGYLASFILPEMYRPLHHWMYGLALLAFGAWKSRGAMGNSSSWLELFSSSTTYTTYFKF